MRIVGRLAQQPTLVAPICPRSSVRILLLDSSITNLLAAPFSLIHMTSRCSNSMMVWPGLWAALCILLATVVFALQPSQHSADRQPQSLNQPSESFKATTKLRCDSQNRARQLNVAQCRRRSSPFRGTAYRLASDSGEQLIITTTQSLSDTPVVRYLLVADPQSNSAASPAETRETRQ